MIKSQEIDKSIHNKLLKPYNEELTEADLKLIKSLVIKKHNLKNEEVEYDFSDFKELTNIEELNIEFININDDLINNLNSLSKLVTLDISSCELKTNAKIQNELKMLILSDMNEQVLGLFENCYNVEYLTLIEFENINIEKILKFKNLKYLCLYNSNITNFKLITEFNKLSILNLDGSKLDNEEILKQVELNVKMQRRERYLLEM